MKKQYGDYYLGLDIGTASVGWAVTDLNYKMLKFNGKSMWGIRLFDEAKTAEERRLFRSARRRGARQTQRIQLLQEIFSEEMAKVDFGFFMRLKESKLYEEDKTEKQPNGVFNDTNYKDKDFYEEYPTIYHLRKELIENKEPHDIRLVYLAIHHILKHRGHFLYQGEFSDVSELRLEPMLIELNNITEEYMGFMLHCVDTDLCKTFLTDQTMNVTNKKKSFESVFEYDKEHEKKAKAMIALLAKGKVKLSDLYGDDSLIEAEQNSISFEGDSLDENEAIYRMVLQDRYSVIEKLKGIYDWGVLQYVLSGEKSISNAKVSTYKQHHDDLVLLKAAVRQYQPKKYKTVFGIPKNKKANYSAYIGMCDNKGKKQVIEKNCTQQEFCDFLSKEIFKNVDIDEDKYPRLEEKITNSTLLPKQKVKDNGVIPYQIHKKELEIILTNAAAYLPFLNEIDETGISGIEKISSILTFRIPYYVGPINGAHENGTKGFYWAAKKSNEPVRPWNFENVIDLEESAERFIRRMTNKCSYLHSKDVIPKDSLLYSKYMVLNELNNLRINGEKISVDLKQAIYNDLFLSNKKVTQKKLKMFLAAEGYGQQLELSGIDGDFKASMSSYLDFKEMLDKDTFSDNEKVMIDEIIKYIVLFGEDKKILKNKVRKLYGNVLSNEQIAKVAKKKYNGWGRFSKEFLKDLCCVDESTGEYVSIMTLLYNHPDNPNLMQLLSNEFPFSKMIEEENAFAQKSSSITYDDLNDLYVSVPVKRSIWQTITIVKELTRILGHEPKKVFIEMARGANPNQKGRTVSRQKQLLELYKSCKADELKLYEELEQQPEDALRSDKLYLYYTQLGRCMYTGQRIELSNLSDYDIDHIYPQSKVMDDSLDNRVLVLKTENAKKSDRYPLNEEVRNNMRDLWKMLYYKKLISKTKYERLTRNTPFREDELVGFVSRQIVETRQSTKAVAQLLDRMFDRTEIVYVKAANVSEFRHGVDDYEKGRTKPEINKRKESNKFVKCRSVNDYHHAKDAYLNIVVGNVFNSKFTSNPSNFFKEKSATYSFNAMYKFPITRGGVIAWEPSSIDKDGTMAVIRKQMGKNDILYTRYSKEAKGGLFDQTIMKKGHGQVPLKAQGAISEIEKYGGYNKASGAYFFIVEHTQKRKKVRTIETVPAYKKNQIKSKDDLRQYCIDFLGLKEPRILIGKIKIDTLFELNGFKMQITGKNGASFVLRNANQLVIRKDYEEYIKRIDNFMLRRGKDTMITSFDKISNENNLLLYDLFVAKMKTTIYSVKFSGQIKILEDGRSKFEALSIEEQCEVLKQLQNFFTCDRTFSNLMLLGGVGKAGILTLGKNITTLTEFYIINQSPTGLFEQRIKISEL